MLPNLLHRDEKGALFGSFLVSLEGVGFPLLIAIPPEKNNTLLVTYNGAVNRTKSPDGLVFQRSSWIPDFKSTVVSIADPTVAATPNLAIGWGQIGPNHFGPKEYARILAKLRNILALPSANHTLHFGSSAGGFQAICTAVFDRGSSVLANNPQLDWSLYSVQWQVKKVKNQVLQIEENYPWLLEEEPWRVNVWKLFEKHEYLPPMEVLINIASESDFNVQLPEFLSGIKNLHFLNSEPDLNCSLYRDDTAGHNPLDKKNTIKAIIRNLKLITPAP